MRPGLALSLVAIIAGCGSRPDKTPESPMTVMTTPRVERLMISGHSLTDPPLPQQLAAIAASQGRPLQWNMQSIGGSTIAARSRGTGNGGDRKSVV